MLAILAHREPVEDYLKEYLEEHQGAIYQPVEYILGIGGKRLRPCLLMTLGEAMGAKREQLLPLAAAIEVFHNFTLLHDDIMDASETRRGQDTVHVKWNVDQAILSGDIMFALSYDLLHRSRIRHMGEAASLFTLTAKEVCIGQQMDMDFEERDKVGQEEYLDMIRLKTSVLLGAATGLAAIATSADEEQFQAAYDFGLALGMSFQIQDDILDSFGEKASVGKRIGGDILNNKKTLLYIKALEKSDEAGRERLRFWYAKELDEQEKIDEVKSIMRDSGALEELRALQRDYAEEARQALSKLDLQENGHQALEELIRYQTERNH